MFSFAACNTCRGNADKHTDTVKVQVCLLSDLDVSDKENGDPELVNSKCAKPVKTGNAQRRQAREPEEQRRHREQQRQQQQQQEQQQLLLQQQQQQQEQEQQELLRRKRQEHRERQLALEQRRAEEAEERRRLMEEELAKNAEELRRRREEDARRRAEEAPRQEQLKRFLSKHGFSSPNEPKKRTGMLSSGFAFPLHVAARAADAEAVRVLLWGGADKSVVDSAKLTPLALAQKLNKRQSHKLVIAALTA